MKQVTVFGGTGFIGRHLIRQLAKTGAIIRVPTRDMEKALLLKSMGDIGQIVPIPCNANDDASVARAIGTSDTVMNLLGILFENKASTFESVHVETAARIARTAHDAGARKYVHMSALAAHADSGSLYARTKAAGEKAARSFFPTATVLRPSIVFGPEDNFFNMFASLARFSPFLPLIGGGHTKFQPVYAGDVAGAFMRVLASNEASGETYELGGPQVYSFREMMALMLYIIGRSRYLISLPWSCAKTQAFFLEIMPKPLLTRDQVELLKTDSVVSGTQAKTFDDLGIEPTALEIILPTYMQRFRAKSVPL